MLRTIKIIFEDENLAVFDKPAGLIINAKKKNQSCLTDILNRQFKGIKYYPCHRLDKQTSGLILYAKSKNMRDKLMDYFKRREVKKSYVAFLHGYLKNHSIKIDDKIDGKQSISIVKLLIQKRKFAVVELIPLTGRKNQLRIHCKRIHHPIVGERKFVFAKDYDVKFKRLALHANKLSFKHPVTNKDIKFEIDLPDEMKRFLKND